MQIILYNHLRHAIFFVPFYLHKRFWHLSHCCCLCLCACVHACMMCLSIFDFGQCLGESQPARWRAPPHRSIRCPPGSWGGQLHSEYETPWWASVTLHFRFDALKFLSGFLHQHRELGFWNWNVSFYFPWLVFVLERFNEFLLFGRAL